jgi:N-methylhydantoinase A
VIPDWVIGVDIGGTFTDVVAVSPAAGRTHQLKVPSSCRDPGSAVGLALTALAGAGILPSDIRLLMHSTTVITNAIIERRLARTALVTTRGFKDVLEIGRHWRRQLYDPFMAPPEPLIPRELRFEVAERMDAQGEEVQALDGSEVEDLVEQLRQAGIEAIAVVFLHSYRNPQHEEQMAGLLRAKGKWVVCCSTELSREIREFERTSTTVLNTTLVPLADHYIAQLKRSLEDAGAKCHFYVMESNGGAMPGRMARRRPVAMALSGPVAGVGACCNLGRETGRRNLIGFDMGGTSTDVSLITHLEPRYATEINVGGLPVRLPSIQIHSIGAGGGSIASVDSGGGLRVGPESAGAEPGPASYGRGGTRPTVTDCQLILARLSPDAMLAGSLALDLGLARRAVADYLAKPLGLSVEQAAAGVIEVANAAMEGAIRVALRHRGDDPRDYDLVAFGGAGPLHCAELARKLNIGTVIVPPHPGTFSALGVLLADVRLDFARSELHQSGEDDLVGRISRIFDALAQEAQAEIDTDPALHVLPVTFERSCDVRYRGQAYDVNIGVPPGSFSARDLSEMLVEFHRRHERAYGFSSPQDACEFVTYRIAARVRLQNSVTADGSGKTDGSRLERQVFDPVAGLVSTAVLDRRCLSPGDRLTGPAIIHQFDATTYVPSFATAEVEARGNILVSVNQAS